MNALELAEWLEHNAIELPADWTTGEPISNMTKSATMLRQQHAEIEALKAMNDKLKEVIETSIDRHNAIARMK